MVCACGFSVGNCGYGGSIKKHTVIIPVYGVATTCTSYCGIDCDEAAYCSGRVTGKVDGGYCDTINDEMNCITNGHRIAHTRTTAGEYATDGITVCRCVAVTAAGSGAHGSTIKNPLK